MSKTIAIVGAGPGLGLSIAEKFGEQGFQVAMIARSEESLGGMTDTLREKNIVARGFVGDVRDEQSLEAAFDAINEVFGFVDVLEYSPISMEFVPPSEVTTHIASRAFQFQVLGAISSVQQVLPAMLRKNSGTILFTGGRSAIVPMAKMGSLSPMASAMRNYAYVLSEELEPKGIFVGTATVCCLINDEVAASIANEYWSLYKARDRVEIIIGENIRIENGLPVRFD